MNITEDITITEDYSIENMLNGTGVFHPDNPQQMYL